MSRSGPTTERGCVNGSLDWKNETDEVRSFPHYICNFNEGTRSGIQKINQSTRLRIAPLKLGIAQSTGSTVGMSLKVAMTDLESGHST